jgi:hypothetical protein
MGLLGSVAGAIGGALGAINPALGSAVGGTLSSVLKSNEEQKRYEAEQALAQQNMAMQKEFAQQGIRWKVEDAKQAGIHPLYALGANTISFNPVQTGSSGSYLSDMGQDISRAIHATRTFGERQEAVNATANALKLQNMELQNQLLASQIAKMQQTPNPPMPTYDGFAPTTADVGQQGIKVEPAKVIVTDKDDRSRIAGTKAGNMRIVVNKYGDTMLVPQSQDVADAIESGGVPVQTEYFVKNRLYPLWYEGRDWVKGLFK